MSSFSMRVERSSNIEDAVRRLLEDTPVSALMASPVRCAKQTMTRAQLAHIMLAAEISAIPIVDDTGVVMGIVSKTDMVREDYGDARYAGAAGQVEKFMTPFVLRLRPHDSLAAAINVMSAAGVHHVVVTDAKGHAAGMLSTLDVMRWLARVAGPAEASETDTAVM